MEFWTNTIIAPLVILKDDGALFISIEAQGGTVDVLGTAEFKGVPSSVATITNGNTWTVQSTIGNGTLEVTITPSAAAAIMVAFQ